MSITLNPYIVFDGNAEEAMNFYRHVFGGELTLSRYGDLPEAGFGEDEASKVMHAMLVTPDGLTLMGADQPAGMEFRPGNTSSISLSGDDEAKLRAFWEGLSDGGQVQEPLTKAPWGDTFGMCLDRFSIGWMVNIAG